MRETKTQFFMNVRVDNLTMDTALQRVEQFIADGRNGGKAKQVFFTNVHSIHLSRDDQQLQEVINKADMVLPDGSGLMIAGKLLGKPVRENLNGTDFTPRVCEKAEAEGWSVYLLGARQNIVKRCFKNMQQMFPKLNIVGYHHGYFGGKGESRVINEINSLKPDILLIALGSPLQEKWIAKHASRIEAKVCFAVGGLFDFLSKDKPRAPVWVRKAGLEWLFRFVHDPVNKWDRIFIEIPVFLSMIFTKRQELITEEVQHSLE